MTNSSNEKIISDRHPYASIYGMSQNPKLAILVLGIGSLLVSLATAAQAGVMAGGYNFLNFDGPGFGTNAGAGTNMNGIANNGAAVGVGISNTGTFTNFVRNPNGSFTTLNINGSTTAMAFGINSAGNVVGAVGGTAFYLPFGGTAQSLTTLGSGSAAFGINDMGNIVGQFTQSGGTMPGFFLPSNSSVALTTINAPSGPNTVNAQGINNNGLIVGFYVGNDGQAHGFLGLVANAVGGTLTGTAIADPTIPPVVGEPGATFVFSQVLGVNDHGIAVGYYGDSTTSQHGFFYNTLTGQYTFLDDPSAAFNNGVEVTQITGITNSGEITGFYSDANGVFHGFVASPVPEPASLTLAGAGLLATWLAKRRAKAATDLHG